MTLITSPPPTTEGSRMPQAAASVPNRMPSTTASTPHLRLARPLEGRDAEILTPAAIAFLTELHDRFARRRHDRLAARERRRFEIGTGDDPHFRADTAHIRDDPSWRVAGAGHTPRRVVADVRGVRAEVRVVARADLEAPALASGEAVVPAPREAVVQLGEEGDRRGGEDLGIPALERAREAQVRGGCRGARHPIRDGCRGLRHPGPFGGRRG